MLNSLEFSACIHTNAHEREEIKENVSAVCDCANLLYGDVHVIHSTCGALEYWARCWIQFAKVVAHNAFVGFSCVERSDYFP